eukprot:TRINITY_DN7372_c0_g3_i1.p1 TRINITY_DN7372_c0_g3~~TRINITY_DN7372_c0_g3_i1.p1  ORF type:complete len:1087 (+),score=170.82 TRINITY_DN7372_c0_g3_i1:32-3292(+)
MVELRWSQSLLCLRVLAIVDSVTFAVFAHGTDSAAYHLSNESGGDTRSIQLIMPQIPMIPMVAGVDFPAPDDAKIGANMHKMESLLGGVLRAVEETYGGCGVSATLRADGRWERSDSLTPKCGTVMATNCSFSYAQLQCPEDCPFLVPHEHYACRFQCVLSSQCYTANLDRAFGNEKTHLCDSCDLEGCKWCASQSECHECHDGFHIVTDDDGRRTCAFSLDHGGWWAKILYVLGALIGMILLTSVGYCCCGSQNPNAADNYLSIYQGRRQRHLSKVHKWDLGSLQRPREFYNLAANVHSRDILGVGFALFYNTIAFYFCVWGVMFVVTQWLYSDDRLQVALPKATSDYAVLASESIVVSKAEPLLLVTPMQHCWEHSQTGVEEILHVFAVRKFYAVSILFIFFFAASLYFAFAQKRFARWFDSRSVSMSDFVLAVHGLPAGSTNEVQLKRWFTGECGRLAPQSVVHGVSIGYCYKHIEAEVSDMLSRLSTLAELHLDADVKTEKDDSVTNTKAQHAEIYDKVKQDRERVKTWFESGSAEELRSTGSAFLVFESSKGKEALLAAYAKDPNCLRHPSAPNDPIHLEAVESQPPDIFWENLSVTTSTLKWNIAKAVLKVLVVFLNVNIFVVIPYIRFMVLPYMMAGRSAGGPKMMIAGIVLGIVNGQLGGQVWGASSSIGFARKDRMDMCIFILNTVITVANTMLNLYVTLFGVSPSTSWNAMGDTIKQCKTIGEEYEMVRNMYLMLMPGQLFVNTIMGLVMGNVVPFMQHSLVQKIIYAWKALPDFLLVALKLILPWAPESVDHYPRRNAEGAFRAGQIGLPYEYTGIINNMIISVLMMSFVSPYNARIFSALVAWSVFYYFFCRYMHFRVQSVCFYSTKRLDATATVLIGIPLAYLAVVAMEWAFRAELLMAGYSHLSKEIVFFATGVSVFALWCLTLYLFVRPFERQDVEEVSGMTVDDVRRECIFSWYNCNPVYILKAAHKLKYASDVWDNPLPYDDKQIEPIYYMPGKEYLFFPREMQPRILDKLRDSLEFETYLESFLHVLNHISKVLCCRFGDRRKDGVSPEESRALLELTQSRDLSVGTS